MEILTEELDYITSVAAGEILNDADQQISRWKSSRTANPTRPTETAFAQADDLGLNIIPEIYAYILTAAEVAKAWLQANHGGVESSLLAAAIIEGLRHAFGSASNRLPKKGLNEAEIEVIRPIIAREVAEAFLRRTSLLNEK